MTAALQHGWKIAAAVLCFVLASAFLQAPQRQPGKRPVLVVGVDNAPPYYFIGQNGQLTGVAVEVFERAAKHLNYDLRFAFKTGVPDSFLRSHQVDLWPVLHTTASRVHEFHMTLPWLFNTESLVRLQSTPRLMAGQHIRVAHWNNPLHTEMARRFLPNAILVPKATREAVMSAVCRGEVDGGWIEARVLGSMLLARPDGCGKARLATEFVPGAGAPLAIAAVKSVQKEADEIHREISKMAKTGELSDIFENWSSMSANELQSITAMNEAEQKTRYAYVSAFLVLLTAGLLFWQFRRIRRAYALARREYAERMRAEEAFRAADQTKNTVLEGAGEGICGLDASGHITFVNTAAARLLAIVPAQVENLEFHALVHGNSLVSCETNCALRGLKDGLYETKVSTAEFRRTDGSALPVEFVLSPLMQNGQLTGSVITFQDITARKRADVLDNDRNSVLEMLAENASLDSLFDAIVHLVERQFPGLCCTLMTARDGRLELSAAPSLPYFFRDRLHSLAICPDAPSCGTAAFLAKPIVAADLATDPRWKPLRAVALSNGIQACWSYPILSCSDTVLGTVALYSPTPGLPDANHRSVAQIACRLARLAIEQTRLTQELHHQARHDSLTGLPNRFLFKEKLEQSIAGASQHNSNCIFYYIDLDRFKQINDTLSHQIGDLFLREVAKRLQSILPPSATLARLGGDEFGIVIPSIGSMAAAEQLACSLLDNMVRPFSIEGHTLFGSASVGISVSTSATSAAELQSHADQAMYRAKALGRNRYQFYTEDLSRDAIVQLETEKMLRESLAFERFELFYQPQCRTNGDLIGFESLLRLRHPERGLVSPQQFIPVAEDSGLIVPIGAWVLRETCRQISAWRREGAPTVPVAINVSAAQFSQGNFAELVASALSEFQLSPSALHVELTESMIMRNFDDALAQMTQLRQLGVHLSIDDFGTGYSSLSYLHRLPVETIKIDQSFVRAMDAPVSTRPLVQAIIAAAGSLKCNVIAEGVETDAQRRELQRMGCEHMQGYFFGRPQPAAEAMAPYLLELAS